MKTCDTCGEEIAPQSSICPYCESPQAWSPPTTNGPAIKTINLEAGLPTVEEALRLGARVHTLLPLLLQALQQALPPHHPG